MGFASLLQWLPSASSNDSEFSASKISPQKWQALASARQQRLPLIVFSSPEKHGQGHQSMVLKLDQKTQQIHIDMPYPALPSTALNLPSRIFLSLKQPGTYRHWHIEGRIVERAQDEDGPFFKVELEDMLYKEDRRRQPRFSFKENTAEISCTPAMEPPIYGDLDNISLGGVCFKARGNLQQSDAFYMAHHGKKSHIPVSIQLNNDDKLVVNIQVLAMQVIKKPYLHTRIRARFPELTDGQKHVLAALTAKSIEVV